MLQGAYLSVKYVRIGSFPRRSDPLLYLLILDQVMRKAIICCVTHTHTLSLKTRRENCRSVHCRTRRLCYFRSPLTSGRVEVWIESALSAETFSLHGLHRCPVSSPSLPVRFSRIRYKPPLPAVPPRTPSMNPRPLPPRPVGPVSICAVCWLAACCDPQAMTLILAAALLPKSGSSACTIWAWLGCRVRA